MNHTMKVTGKGTIQPLEDKPKSRCRRWRLWLSTDSGRKSKRFEGTYSQAESALESWRRDLEGTIPNADTFAHYARAWLDYRERSGLYQPRTIGTNRYAIEYLCESPLAPKRMDEIRPDDCRNALLWIRDNPKRAGQLTGTTLQKVHGACRQIFQQAKSDRDIAFDPMENVPAPKIDTQEVEPLSWDEMMGILDELDKMKLTGYVMCVYFIVCLGIRRSESVAILDANVDRSCRIVSAVKDESGKIVGDPKSDAGERAIPMSTRLIAKVEQWRAVREARGIGDAEILNCNMFGGVIHPQNLSQWWRSHRGQLGVGFGGPHRLRHSNLTHMARYMSAFDLMHYAGWSTLKPARIYIHNDDESLQRGVRSAWGE